MGKNVFSPTEEAFKVLNPPVWKIRSMLTSLNVSYINQMRGELVKGKIGQLILYLVIIADVMEWWWGQGAHLWLTTAVLSDNREIYMEHHQCAHKAWRAFDHSRAPVGIFTRITRKMRRQIEASVWVWDSPPLFNCRYKVWPRKHGEQTVAIGWRRLIAGAGRVPLIGWPAAVHSLTEDTTRGGVCTVFDYTTNNVLLKDLADV